MQQVVDKSNITSKKKVNLEKKENFDDNFFEDSYGNIIKIGR